MRLERGPRRNHRHAMNANMQSREVRASQTDPRMPLGLDFVEIPARGRTRALPGGRGGPSSKPEGKIGPDCPDASSAPPEPTYPGERTHVWNRTSLGNLWLLILPLANVRKRGGAGKQLERQIEKKTLVFPMRRSVSARTS
eukprot:8383573-Pyramimonas_sp.AAC.1